MTRMNAWKTNTIIFVLLTAALVIAGPYAGTTKAASKEGLRRAEIKNRTANPVRPARPADLDAKQQFLEIERIARLPQEEQIKQLPRLYHDLAPPYMNSFITGIISYYRSNILGRKGFDGPGGDHLSNWSSQLSDAAKESTPEEVAEEIGSRMWLNVALRVRSIQVFKDHSKQTMELIDSDLDSEQADRVGRAASTILAMKWRSYSMRLLEILLAESADLKAIDGSKHPISSPVRRALIFLYDPAIIPVITDKVKQNPRVLVHVAGFFQHPLYHEPADPMLLALVSSKDREVSYYAAYALAECKDARLAPLAAKFAADKNPAFDGSPAIGRSIYLGKSFLSIRKDLLPLLKDKKEDVFKQALRCFARHKDPEAGKVILDMLKRSEIPRQLETAVMQSFREMAGSSFGYSMHNWGPGNRKNSEAIEKFQKLAERFR